MKRHISDPKLKKILSNMKRRVRRFIKLKYKLELVPVYIRLFQDCNSRGFTKFDSKRTEIWISTWPFQNGMLHHEYEHINDDQDIGDIWCQSWKEYYEVILIHELAHVIDSQLLKERKTKQLQKIVNLGGPFYNTNNIKRKNLEHLKPIDIATQKMWHGFEWQQIYRDLRKVFINHRV